MSEILTPADRDQRTGRFLSGHKAAGPGRPVGARSKLGEAFIEDLRDCWNRRGIEVLERCADEDPAALLRAIVSLLPKDINLNLDASADAAAFALNFRAALAMLHGEPPPGMHIIESKSHVRKPG